MGRLRRRELIPEDTPITGTLKDPKIVYGQFGRQVQCGVLVTKGDQRGTEFRDWFSFSKDAADGEEFVSYGGPLYQALVMVEPEIDRVLDDESLSERKYQAFVKKAVAKLDGFEIMARVGIKASKANPEKKRNCLEPGTFGPAVDPEEGFEDLDMGKAG